MKGDFSRFTFDPTKHYSGVRMQQGRVQLDADWNEQLDIAAHALITRTSDLIGAGAAPESNPGFAIRVRSGLLFDGVDDAVAFGEVAELRCAPGDGFTLEVVLEIESDTRGGTLLWLSDCCTLAIDPDRRLVFGPSGPTGSEASAGGSSDADPLISAEQIPVGRRVRVRAVRDAGERLLYIDGRLAGCDAGSLGYSAAPPTLVAGASGDGDTRSGFFDGMLCEIVIWQGGRRLGEYDDGEEGGHWDDPVGDPVFFRRFEPEHGDGAAGAPGFVRELRIGAGRYYVDGVLVENEKDLPLPAQPDLPGDDSVPLDGMRPGRYLAYLDVWDRLLTSIEDPSLREIALGGPDTTVRTRTVWQVKLLPVKSAHEVATPDDRTRLLAALGGTAMMRAQRRFATTEIDNHLYRIEIHDGGGAYAWPRPSDAASRSTAVESADGKRLSVEQWYIDGRPWAPGQLVEIYSQASDKAGVAGTLARIVTCDPENRTVTTSPVPADIGQQQGVRMRRIATLKWSRENGSVAAAIRSLTAGSPVVTLTDLGNDDEHFREGELVEIADDASALRGGAGALRRIIAIDRGRLQITLDRAPADGVGTDRGKHPLVRRWDHAGDGPGVVDGGVILLQEESWLDIESGVQVRFDAGGSYCPGDYWVVPARTLTGDVEWPRDGAGAIALPPHGVEHRLAPLALIHVGNHGAIEVEDYRTMFASLTTGYLPTAGGRITGSLVVDRGVTVREYLRVRGELNAGLIVGELAPGMVDSPQILDHSVTRDKLSRHLREDLVPDGASILGTSAIPPEGYDYTGMSFPIINPEPQWHTGAAVPAETIGWMTGVVVRGRLYCFLSSGEVWEHELASRRWRQRADMPTHRRAFGLGVVNDRIYVVGGIEPLTGQSARLEEYDPEYDRWSVKADMPTPRAFPGVAVANGRLYVVGGMKKGWFGSLATRRNEEYDPLADAWTRRRKMPAARRGFAAGGVNGEVYVVGGTRWWLFGRRATGRNDAYDPSTDGWYRRRSMPTPRAELGLGTVNNRLYAIGGRGVFEWMTTTEEYDPEHDRWVRRLPLPMPRRHLAVTSMHGKVYVIGGATPHGLTHAIDECSIMSTFHIHRKLDRDEWERMADERS